MGPLWALTWQLAAGLGCAVVGLLIAATTTGYLLIAAAVSLFAGPVLLAAGQPGLARGVWVSAVLVTIPLALLRVVPVHRHGLGDRLAHRIRR
ncbi:hypothetical protein ABZS66_61305, partial [Dactylosporangium sp. NPDC005572]|uniref:hypothetical protein n=1 Tax=Dactylosporangium sp. NPDC005572 TaxID=3156889 RepID=UPI0033A6B796